VETRRRTRRLCREEGLTVRKRRGRKRAVGTRAPILTVAAPNARWSVDFLQDVLSDGRRFRVFAAVDDVSRECLALVVDTSISGARVGREPDRIVELRGRPRMVVSDNVPCRRRHGERGREVSSRRSFPARFAA